MGVYLLKKRCGGDRGQDGINERCGGVVDFLVCLRRFYPHVGGRENEG